MESPTGWRRCLQLTVEPSFLLVAYATSVFEAPFHDLLLRKLCQDTPDIPRPWCDSLPDHPTAEEVVHPKAATLLMISSLIESVVPAMVSCLAGAWSDRARSRKPLIVLPLTGYILKFALLAVFMSIPTLPVPYFLFATVPLAITGGWTTFFGAVTSVVGDETGEDGNVRTFRLGLLQVFFIIGLILGSLTSSITLHALGHIGVFLLASTVCFVALLIALFTVSETYGSSSDDGGNPDTCLIKDVFQTMIKYRSNGRKVILILSVLSLGSSIIAYNGESNLYYMYGRKEFKWTVFDFTLYRSISYGLQMIGTLFAVSVLSLRMKIEDAPLAILSYLGATLGSILRAFASTTWMMYVGSVITMFHGAASPMVRSIMSKCVHQNELGKVFMVTTSLEALVPLAGQPLYTYMFSNTIVSFPGAFFMFSALVFFMDLIFNCVIHGTYKWYSQPERQPLITREDSTIITPS
ncbi:probable peptidoglycan muropeptide transporter SLC46 isoform X2 [Hetaerina americana]|uniref:probable peptidoglycan muropeptide transporter SLC46 isoform X2 n=1 Tax=Hetaerina americana TaxID=62018 RepID=UPI003A7F19B5